VGTGASHQGSPDGVVVFTPNGRPPVVPDSRDKSGDGRGGQGDP
jgi:hypothetical protein